MHNAHLPKISEALESLHKNILPLLGLIRINFVLKISSLAEFSDNIAVIGSKHDIIKPEYVGVI